MLDIPFNKPYLTGNESANILGAHQAGHLAGGGLYTRKCDDWLERQTGALRALFTHSCTGALEMAAILADIQPGDEVILPSYTFVSTANAFVLRGAVPVFVDIRPDTMNMDETKLEPAITGRTRAIIPVHYAGVACEMEAILAIARDRNLLVVEDAAQGIMASYRGRPLGSLGSLGAMSFHETKNIISGEGGALLVNDADFAERAEVVLNKGTNRNQFLRGQVDKYTWVDLGSSYLPSEICAGFLWAQMEAAEAITARRLAIWDQYRDLLQGLEESGVTLQQPPPAGCQHNAHMFYLLMPNLESRTYFIHRMAELGVGCIFHYVPLHASPFGLKVGRTSGDMRHTHRAGDCLVRLPLWLGIEPRLGEVVAKVKQVIAESGFRSARGGH